jgi:two-component system, OmpR family, KDP operon response regulator KdpE
MTEIHDADRARAGKLRGCPNGGRHSSAVLEACPADPLKLSLGRGAQVLLADRDRDVVELIAHTLRRAGLLTLAAHDEASALELFAAQCPSVVVLDTNGIDLIQQLRTRSRYAAIIVVTAGGTENERIRALELGADDYMNKPFSYRELLARVRACLRRRQPDSQRDDSTRASRIAVGHLVVDLDRHLATIAGREIHLSPTELRVLHYLMVRVGTVVPTRVLTKEFWRTEDDRTKDMVRVTVHRLRRKLESTSIRPPVLETIPRVGFRLVGEVAA